MLQDLLVSLPSSLAVAALTAWLTVRLSLRSFRSERRWDQKYEAYRTILESIHRMKRLADVHMDAEIVGQTVPEGRKRELSRSHREASDEIAQATDIGSFVISPDAVDALREYLRQLERAKGAEYFTDHLEGGIVAGRQCLETVRKIARRDLGVPV